MAPREILFSFVGNRDPLAENGEPGPVLSLLQHRSFDLVCLFCTGTEYLERGRMVEEALEADVSPEFRLVPVELESPIDHEEILRELGKAARSVLSSLDPGHRISVLLDPGTPQMQTAWFLLVKGGVVGAALLQGIPPRFAAGAYKIKQVDLESPALPHITLAEQPQGDEAADNAGPAEIRLRSSFGSEQARLLGASDAFRDLVERAIRVAAYDVSVMLHGETGTGKELIARLIHERSPRGEKPFIAVNCSTISQTIAESELFGHHKGAFTGATTARPGLFRAGEGGTVFLDEIGDLPLEIQPKLLRTLEERTVVPLGSSTPVSVDVRVLAATHYDLVKSMEAGTFRRDLYERLNQAALEVAPLRERGEDVTLLVARFLEEWNTRYREDKRLDRETMKFLLEYPWPGNIRQLRNAVTGLCAQSVSGEISPELLPREILGYFKKDRRLPEIAASIPESGMDVRALLYSVERDYYFLALDHAGGNRERAARLLGLNAPAYRKALRDRFGVE